MPRYQVYEGEFEGEPTVELVDSTTKSQASIVPGIGAQCRLFTLPHRGETLDLLAQPPDLKTLRDHPVHYGNPILFPFPNRIKDGTFTFDGKTVKLPINDTKSNSAIHGLTITRPWRASVSGADADEGAWVTCSFQSQDFPELAEMFPFPFVANYTYRLIDGRLESEIKAFNVGKGPMPLGFGLHPWFPMPLSPAGTRETCVLRAPVRKVWELENLVPTGRVVPAAEERVLAEGIHVNDLLFDDVFAGLNEESGERGYSESTYSDPGTGLEIAVWSDNAFRELVVYTPPTRPLVCLEPYTCATDAFNLASRGIDGGMITLPPGQVWSARVAYAPRTI